MAKFYIHSGSFKRIIESPNYLDALIKMFFILEKLPKRERLGPMIMLDQRGFVYDLLDKNSISLLSEKYTSERKGKGRKMKLDRGGLVVPTNKDETLYFNTSNVIEVVNRLRGKK